MCNCCSKRLKKTLLTVTGILLIIISVVFYLFYDRAIRWQVRRALVLSEDSLIYEFWRDVPIDIYYYIYMFNTTNPDRVAGLGEDPNLQELGPYVYREKRQKVNITFNTNGTVSYEQIKTYHFDSERSSKNVSINDMIAHLNYPLIVAGYILHREFADNPFMYYMMQTACDNTAHPKKLVDCSLYQMHTVQQILFDGWTDNLIEAVGDRLHLPFTKFSFFTGRNGTAWDGQYNMFTGSTDIDKLGFMNRWKKNTTIGHFRKLSHCDRFDYCTAGDLRPPYQMSESSQPIDIFIGDMCRSFRLSYREDIDYQGIYGKRYVADGSVFDYSMDINRCYCGNSTKSMECPANGVADVSQCVYGAPVYLSYPHFLHADRSYTRFLRGLAADKHRHLFYMDFEPQLAVPLKASAKIQMNLLVERNENMNTTKQLVHQKLYYPQLWLDIRVEMNDEMTKKIKLIVKYVPMICDILALLGLLVGILLVLIVPIPW
ncbi:sensory neuron membrane protein 2-like [Oppia nitens]|uniref:sensory neuron membrane protein 2-like n=1 Tax=Oppia nitens TaxID=1686743 RepID=UPI0023DAD1C4|nr:sensory neuron membrane protein 2-like [Oppia nitens]